MIEDFNFDSIQIKIPQRSENSHKGDFGKVLVLGGCKGMGGAAILSSEASLFCGSGLVHLHTHSTNVEASLKRNPEVMTLGIDNDYETEFKEAKAEVMKIALFRLNEIKNENSI